MRDMEIKEERKREIGIKILEREIETLRKR